MSVVKFSFLLIFFILVSVLSSHFYFVLNEESSPTLSISDETQTAIIQKDELHILSTSINENASGIKNLKIQNAALFDSLDKITKDIEVIRTEIMVKAFTTEAIVKAGINDNEVVEHFESENVRDEDNKQSTVQEQFAKRMMEDSNFDPLASIKENFKNEARDANWAVEYENNITQLFFTESELENAQLGDVKCKSSLCELTVYSSESVYSLGNTLAKSLANQPWRDKEASFMFNDDIGTDGTMVFFIGKDKNSLNFRD